MMVGSKSSYLVSFRMCTTLSMTWCINNSLLMWTNSLPFLQHGENSRLNVRGCFFSNLNANMCMIPWRMTSFPKATMCEEKTSLMATWYLLCVDLCNLLMDGVMVSCFKISFPKIQSYLSRCVMVQSLISYGNGLCVIPNKNNNKNKIRRT